jgi:hypothetical protein
MKVYIFNFICFLMFRSLAKDKIEYLKEQADMNRWFATTFQNDLLELERNDDATQPDMLEIAELRWKCDDLNKIAFSQESAIVLLKLARSFRAFRANPSFWSISKKTIDMFLIERKA